MTFEPVVAAASALGALAILAAFVVRGREIGWELSGDSAFALYVRLASLAGTVVFAVGLAELLRAWLVTAPLPAGFTPARSAVPADQLVRGATLLASGAAFWAVHFFLPRPAIKGWDALYLAFLTVGAAAFGLATIVVLPWGAAAEVQRLFGFQAPSRQDGTLGGGLAALVVWLAHLLRLYARFRHRGGHRVFGAQRPRPRGWRPSPPPPEPGGVGAPLVRPPGTRSAGAAAVPPDDR
jgi:hypothetical protein